MDTYEYKVVEAYYILPGSAAIELDKFGAEGWELVAVVQDPTSSMGVSYHYYFKRKRK